MVNRGQNFPQIKLRQCVSYIYSYFRVIWMDCSTEMLAFDDKGTILNYDTTNRNERRPLEEICSMASKVVHMLDSPGLEKVVFFFVLFFCIIPIHF